MNDTAITNMSGKFYFCSTPQPLRLTATEYAALTWIQVPNMGNHGDTGIEANEVSYPTWDRDTTIKGKGSKQATNPAIEFADVVSPGMTALINAESTPDNYATKVVWPDGMIEYNRGLVMSISYPKGANEDFRRVSVNLSYQDPPLRVAAPITP
jgi:hypothetical protein